jgi:hypothetical protein
MKPTRGIDFNAAAMTMKSIVFAITLSSKLAFSGSSDIFNTNRLSRAFSRNAVRLNP